MKKITLALFLFSALGLTALHAQNGSAVLSQMPAEDGQQFASAMEAMSNYDENQLEALAETLLPYGNKSNTPVQYALHGYAGYVMRPGRETDRAKAVQAYGRALNKVQDRMNKQFLIRQLQLTGKDDAVPFLQPFLADSFLVHQAAQALAAISTPKSKEALRDALEKASSANRIPLIEALGDAHDPKAVKIIAPYTKSSDLKTKKVSLYALANIGDPRSSKRLLQAARSADFQFENTNATGDLMLFVNRLIEEGHKKAAKKIVAKMKRAVKEKAQPAVSLSVARFESRLSDKSAVVPNKLSNAEKDSGFVSLFNGKNLDGWTGNKAGYRVENGAIVVHPGKGSGGNLYTEKEYGNFILRFQFKLTPGANNGIGIRAPLKGDAAYAGMEIQVLDNTADQYKNLQPYQYQGSVYGVIPAKRGYLKPVGEWNSEEIRAEGTKIRVVLNGHVIVDGDIAPAIANGTMDHKSHPGLKNKTGHIGFLGHGAVVYFRDLRIKNLP